ncbi:c-type cytochrome [Cognatilysobacter lacus]|uniref:C-type cytochrome n=1 Tax=Cognatilysobacter lacus TaxID=1643323 RepID=A0A5D8Z4L7_9GAMM|nr:c-type cytochrome [Lysobacter lacus]TZF89689.1 c-type cytochrome [Lysobacter lacus]
MRGVPRPRLALASAAVVTATLLVACNHDDQLAPRFHPGATKAVSTVATPAVAATGVGASATVFVPPGEANIPADAFGDLVRRGRDLFVDTGRIAPQYVGNGLTCSNCHLDAGRLANSAPLWGAWVRYPAYRAKTHSVSSYAERLQGCFVYSMNGKAPPLGSPELASLEAYSYWMAKGAPTGASLPGAGYPKSKKPPAPVDYARGERVFATNCALCHGADGAGQRAEGRYVFPPLWGPDSYNWGAGMHQLDNAAAFIRANMPFGRGGTLTEQDAWDVAAFVNAHERPQDPRFTGDVATTRKRFHDDPNSQYGTVVNGHLLGSTGARR